MVHRSVGSSFDYDTLGRPTHDRVTAFGASGIVDQAVKRISRTYEVRGMLETITSFDNATVGSGSVINQVEMAYNDFGQLITESQEHAGTVNGSTPAVQYAYASGGSSSNQMCR